MSEVVKTAEILKKYLLTVTVILIAGLGTAGALTAYNNSRSLGQGIEDKKISMHIENNGIEILTEDEIVFQLGMRS